MKYNKTPLRISANVPNGTYEVTVTITAHEDITFTIYSQTRRFMVQNEKMKKDEKKDFTFNVSVCDYLRRDLGFTHVEGINIDIMCDGNFAAVSAISPVNLPVIYMAGDSTVTDQPAQYPYDPMSTYCGWGQMLPQYLNTGIAVENQSQSGSASNNFIDVNFTAFKDKIGKGDFLIIEFGHNDQKVKELDAYGGYSRNLKYFVQFAKSKGAQAIICSPINRIIFNRDGTLLNLLGDYRNAAKKAAEEMDVPFLDLWSRTTEFFEAAGPVRAWNYFRCEGSDRDYTHTNDIGGSVIARFAANEIIRNDIEPIASLIKKDMIGVEKPQKAEYDGSVENSRELEHIKTIGLLNIPSAEQLEELDRDITNI